MSNLNTLANLDVKKIADIQLKLAILSGEPWAIKHAQGMTINLPLDNKTLDPEEEMKRKGIPIPIIACEDVDDK
jgi:hypothetical protein